MYNSKIIAKNDMVVLVLLRLMQYHLGTFGCIDYISVEEFFVPTFTK